MVWLSTQGDIKWDAPPEDLITVEEAKSEVQPWNTENAASDTFRARFKDHMQPELFLSLLGRAFLVDATELVMAPEAAAAAGHLTRQ